ncbi:hypothetical protein ABFS83_05G095300 [Erythranthe nasuta]
MLNLYELPPVDTHTDQRSKRPIGSKKARKGKEKASPSSNAEINYNNQVDILEAGRKLRHDQNIAIQQMQEEHRVMAMDTSNCTPGTKEYWRSKRKEIQRKQIAKDLFESSSAHLDDDGFNPFD